MSGDETPEYTAAQRAEPPLHPPRRCPACGQESRAIVGGRCLACRITAAAEGQEGP